MFTGHVNINTDIYIYIYIYAIYTLRTNHSCQSLTNIKLNSWPATLCVFSELYFNSFINRCCSVNIKHASAPLLRITYAGHVMGSRIETLLDYSWKDLGHKHLCGFSVRHLSVSFLYMHRFTVVCSCNWRFVCWCVSAQCDCADTNAFMKMARNTVVQRIY